MLARIHLKSSRCMRSHLAADLVDGGQPAVPGVRDIDQSVVNVQSVLLGGLDLKLVRVDGFKINRSRRRHRRWQYLKVPADASVDLLEIALDGLLEMSARGCLYIPRTGACRLTVASRRRSAMRSMQGRVCCSKRLRRCQKLFSFSSAWPELALRSSTRRCMVDVLQSKRMPPLGRPNWTIDS
jgi:hypothetical protein